MKGLAVLLAVVVAVSARGGGGGNPARHRGGHHDHTQHGQGEWNIEVHDPKHHSVAHATDEHGMHVVINQANLPPMKGGKDYMVGNPYPGADGMPIEYVYGACHMRAVSSHPHDSDIQGSVYMRQPWMGCADVEVVYDIKGLPHMKHGDAVGEHTFKVHKYGDLSNDCANIGPQFWIEDRQHANHGEDDHGCDAEDKCCNYRHNNRNVEGGNLGSFPCSTGEEDGEEEGDLKMSRMHNQFTVMGFHTVVGRSLAVSHMGEVMGCCTIATTNGTAIPDHIVFSDEPDAHHHH